MSKEEKFSETPLMRQYATIKAKYPDALLLFRVGDFYETFGEDAVKTSAILGIVLTKRANVELAGFPYHSLDSYLPKLVRAGQRVAICDQLEDPKLTKKIVKRGVTELVTPGVAFNDKILDHKSNNFLAAIHFDKERCGIAFVDISTGEFIVAEGTPQYIDKLLQSLQPSEIIFQKNRNKEFVENHGNKFYTYRLDEWIFNDDYARKTLLKQFGTVSLKGFGIEELNLAIIAAGAALHYLADMQHDKMDHIKSIARMEEEKFVWLDRFTIRNLELIFSANDNAKTLFDVLDKTISPMGARLLKRWIIMPLKEIEPIEERLEVVNHFVHHGELAEVIKQNIKPIGDLERLISKAAMERISPRELMQLNKALHAILPIKKACEESDNNQLKKIADQLNTCQVLRERITKELMPDPPPLVQKGSVIAAGVSEELDELREITTSGKEYLLKIQQREIERTGIPSLKVGFNGVFGYYIEVTHTHKDKVPNDWVRKQTLVNAERYITEELKHYEEKILGAEEKILSLETILFNNLVRAVSDYIQPIQMNAILIAKLDCLLSFATIAVLNHYTRPQINDGNILDIKNGRHPVIEKQLPPDEPYIANDIYLDNETQQIIIITGPNMSGKSALLRQTALIVLMAKMGSFVPATSVSLGLIDKIFTRVGASDNISSGESTFMVEMNETASILNNISPRSLILLDEIGRGTSTYDGISLAWAIAEYIHNHPTAKAKTLFATHYHELNEMAQTLPRIKNFNVSVKEIDNKVLFMRKLVAGGSEHSFGIHVAKMAGIPNKVLKRAEDILLQLEKNRSNPEMNAQPKIINDNLQLSFFQLDDPLLEQIREEILSIDINTLTPVEALMKLNEIKKLATGKRKS
ncbi:MAG: DNA mismatch repair protein MutS [Bacteroidota bacterium]